MRNAFYLLFVTFIAMTFMCAQRTMAQTSELEVTTIGFTQGDSPISGGLNLWAFGTHGNNRAEFSANFEKNYVAYQFRNVGIEGLHFSPSVGIFRNVPWVGPRMTLDLPYRTSMFIWLGSAFGEMLPGSLSWQPQASFFQVDVKKSFGPLTAGFSYLNWEGVDLYLPYVGGSYQLADRLSFVVNVTYDVTPRKPLFMFGVYYSL